MLHAVDLQCTSAWILDPVWLFNGRLRYGDVKRALEWLVTVFPEVGGRMAAQGILVDNQGKLGCVVLGLATTRMPAHFITDVVAT